jgi:hypothetical protein
MTNWTIVFGAGFAVVASFDIGWFLRLAYTRIVSIFRQPLAVTEVCTNNFD